MNTCMVCLHEAYGTEKKVVGARGKICDEQDKFNCNFCIRDASTYCPRALLGRFKVGASYEGPPGVLIGQLPNLD